MPGFPKGIYLWSNLPIGKLNTPRHAAEFWMIEPEVAFADLNDNMELAEDMIKYIFDYVIRHAPEEMEFFNNFIDKGLLERLNNVIQSEFGRISYTDAVEILKSTMIISV